MVKGEVYMDELEALRILRGEKSPETEMAEEISEKKKRGPLPAGVLLIFIILGFLLQFVVAFYANTHPLDRILFKMAVMKNYTVTVTTLTSTKQMIVDGDVIYDGSNYYESVGDDVYRYYVDGLGVWRKGKLGSNTLTGGVDSDMLMTLLNKDSYQFKLIPIGKYKMRHGLNPGGLENVTATVIFGQFNANGSIRSSDWWGGIVTYTVHIRIGGFGSSKLELPTVGEKVK
jgi:hypothetical protein